MNLNKLLKEQRVARRDKLLKERKHVNNWVDVRNEQLGKDFKQGDTHMMVLHATKGYRRVSVKRLLPENHGWNAFWQTINRAQLAKHGRTIQVLK